MDTDAIRQVSTDRALYDPEDDRLGYAPFAKHMADSLLTMIPAQGLVVALYGAWGAGKSTCLSFIEHYLRRSDNYEDQLTIVKFNPWWFSGQQDLAMQYFNQLLATISVVDPGSEDLRIRLADFAQLVSRLPLPYAWTGEAVADILRPEGKDIFALKDEVERLLASQPRRLLVIIDDIDRLTAEEIRQLFRVIKAVANFPSPVTYGKALIK